MKTTITITVKTPDNFFTMQDWLGRSAQALPSIAEHAIKKYITDLTELYEEEHKS